MRTLLRKKKLYKSLTVISPGPDKSVRYRKVSTIGHPLSRRGAVVKCTVHISTYLEVNI